MTIEIDEEFVRRERYGPSGTKIGRPVENPEIEIIPREEPVPTEEPIEEPARLPDLPPVPSPVPERVPSG